MMTIAESALKILSRGCVCDHCLGRQFGKLLTGTTNELRGKYIRGYLALEHEREKTGADPANFHGFSFRNRKTEGRKGSCIICGDIFERLDDYAQKIVESLGKTEYSTFLIGVKMSDELVMNEEKLWEGSGIEHTEPLKSEISRELGKALEKLTGKRYDEKRPDVQVTLGLQRGTVDVHVSSLYFYGRYNKLVRGIPQTKWEKYRVTVEDIIAKPFMKSTGAVSHALHAAGREDIDARCLGWRPFVLELERPAKRLVDLKRMAKAVNSGKRVKIKDLRLSDKKEVVSVKSMRPDKTYRVLVRFEKPPESLGMLKKLRKIRQQTPRRVLHRRANLERGRTVKAIKWRRINNKKYVFTITTDAGLYVKELVSGDSGRTKPSIAALLGTKAEVEQLDVIKIKV